MAEYISYEERLEAENDKLKAALRAILRRIEEADNPSDLGISRNDEAVIAANSLLEELK